MAKTIGQYICGNSKIIIHWLIWFSCFTTQNGHGCVETCDLLYFSETCIVNFIVVFNAR